MQVRPAPGAKWSLWAVPVTLGLALAVGLCPLPRAALQAAPVFRAGANALRASGQQVLVQGTVDCSEVLGAAGHGGSPLDLRLSSGSHTEAAQYPRSLAIPGENGIFGTPTYELYRFKTTVPDGQKAATVHWALSCQDKDGGPAGSSSGHFPLSRSFTPSHPATRDICNHGGTEGIVLTICSTALSTKLGACAFGVISAGTGSKVLDVGSLVLDPPKTWKAKLEAALSEISSPLVGVILACAPVLLPTRTTTMTPGTTTTSVASSGWPTHRDDVNIAVSAWLGSDFVFPDWMSCDPNYCIAGSARTVYVFSLQGGVDQIATVSESVGDPAAALSQLRIPQTDVGALLAPTG